VVPQDEAKPADFVERPTMPPESIPPSERVIVNDERYLSGDYDQVSNPVTGGPITSIPPRASLSERPLRESDADYAEDRRRALPLPEGVKTRSSMPTSVVLEGKYRLRNELGRGAMGTVFLAEDQSLKRNVAVKFLLPELVSSEECATRFRTEAVAMASIRNENVAQIYTYGDDEGAPYFVMEYLDGETVEYLIDSHNRRGFYIALDDVVDVMIQALVGLASIHRAGAVHRDIKPANIMLCADPMRAVIMDFGLVRSVKVEDDLRTLAGTPAYIAPELVEGRKDADSSPLCDIYSMGTTFYELLTGSIPFGGDTWIEILQKHITEVPVFPSDRRPGLPEKIDDIVLRAMAKEPHERYPTAEEFIEELAEVMEMPMRPSIFPSYRGSRAPARSKSTPPGRRSQPRTRAFDTPNRVYRSTPSGSRGRLLVADSDSEFRALVHGTAKAAVPGCRVHSATDGTMALEMVEKEKPHVLLVDLSLPKVNGLEVVATIRGEQGNEDLKIIVVADRGGEQESSILKMMGVSRFLSKPVDADELAVMLRPLLERPLSRPSQQHIS
jgi:serine/threonine-protein kinase